MKIQIRPRYLTTQWEVIGKYGYRETLIAVRETEAEAKEYAKAYSSTWKGWDVVEA